MVELGDQTLRIGKTRFLAKEYFELLGIIHTSIDINGRNGACSVDLSVPITDEYWLGRFDILTNMGTLEHVSDQYECWRNMHNLVRIGGVFISAIPFSSTESDDNGNSRKHCDYFYKPPSVIKILKLNNYKIMLAEHLYDTGCFGYCYVKTCNDFKMTKEELDSWISKA